MSEFRTFELPQEPLDGLRSVNDHGLKEAKRRFLVKTIEVSTTGRVIKAPGLPTFGEGYVDYNGKIDKDVICVALQASLHLLDGLNWLVVARYSNAARLTADTPYFQRVVNSN